MKYSLVSDLHLDHLQKHIQVSDYEDIIVVAGDCANGLAGLKYLEKLRRSGHTVIACDGNHEHYSNLNQKRTIIETTLRFKEFFPSPVYFICGVEFISVNGWYYIEDPEYWAQYMNDTRCGDYNEINHQASEDYFFLEFHLNQARRSKQRVVVTTHTAPGPETLDQRFDGHRSNSWYMNPRMGELRREFSDIILVWNHGHTHAPADKIVDGVRTVCNPRGYPGENPNWKPLTVSLDT